MQEALITQDAERENRDDGAQSQNQNQSQSQSPQQSRSVFGEDDRDEDLLQLPLKMVDASS